MKITNFKDKTYNRFYELLTEDDDLEDIKAVSWLLDY